MAPRKKDDLFQQPNAPVPFEFDESVARVFDNMLERSVPFYKECQKMVVDLTCQFHQPETSVYDLGCSTGTLLKQLAQALPKKSRALLVGLDNSAPMLKKAQRKLKDYRDRCELIEADLEGNFTIEQASAVILNYTLQFVPPRRRVALLRKIHRGLVPGGCLILIEKVRAEGRHLDEAFVEQYHGYKRSRGYSRLEIARKREALENVLVPLSASKNAKMLETAGFHSIDLFFKWFNFAGWIATKSARRPRKGAG